MRYAYYPGCSITRSARAYADSTEAVAGPLGIELVEIDDWNCCGATEYIAINKSAAYALVGRNLALAAKIDDVTTLTAPCSACYLNLKKVDRYMGKYPDLGERTNTALAAGGLHYKPGALEVKHLLDVITEDIGTETIAERVTQPLTGIKLAPYYGCLIARPELDDHPVHDTEYPTNMDDLLTALGAEVVDFPVKTNCCGGHMAQISADTAYDLIGNIISVARRCRCRCHCHHLPHVPAQPGRVPDAGKPQAGQELQDADPLLYPGDRPGDGDEAVRARFRPGNCLRQGVAVENWDAGS